MEAALADLEMVVSAYPDEISVSTDSSDNTGSPLRFTLRFSETANCLLEFARGYPETTNVLISSYRSSPKEKARMEAVVAALRSKASECLELGVEGGLVCCGAAFEVWNEFEERRLAETGDAAAAASYREISSSALVAAVAAAARTSNKFAWKSGEPLLDRKSTFQAHVCGIESESDVHEALQQLFNSHNNKLQRAAHNMVRPCGKNLMAY
jgi:hypothetical protein